MTFGVTAASGQLGSAIVKGLLKDIDSKNIIGLARTPAKASGLGVEIRPGDYSKPGELEKSLNGIDSLLIVSGLAHPDERIGQHRNVINAAKSSGVQKIVYTSIAFVPAETGFDPIINSNRQTEEDIRNSGLKWIIGRNGLYIDADLEYIEQYKKLGKIINSAGDGKCAYTSREELAFAYSKLLVEDKNTGKTLNLCGEAITQQQLAVHLNKYYGLNLTYEYMEPEAYTENRVVEIGEFYGKIIGGIYANIGNGMNDIPSGFEQAAGRPHKSIDEMIAAFGAQ